MFLSYEQQREFEDSRDQEAMTQGEYMSAALRQYAGAHGEADPTRAWVLTPYDTWERNPHYIGPAVRHPEDDQDDDEAAFYDEGERPGAVFRAATALPSDWPTYDADDSDEIPF